MGIGVVGIDVGGDVGRHCCGWAWTCWALTWRSLTWVGMYLGGVDVAGCHRGWASTWQWGCVTSRASSCPRKRCGPSKVGGGVHAASAGLSSWSARREDGGGVLAASRLPPLLALGGGSNEDGGGILTASFWRSTVAACHGQPLLVWAFTRGFDDDGEVVVVRKETIYDPMFVEFEPREFSHMTPSPRHRLTRLCNSADL